MQHGQTGFLVEPNDKDSLVSYIRTIDQIDRRNCREWVENNASTGIFAKKVIEWLTKVIEEFKLLPK